MRLLSKNNHWYLTVNGGADWIWIGSTVDITSVLNLPKHTKVIDIVSAHTDAGVL
jgi:hypothetical protein